MSRQAIYLSKEGNVEGPFTAGKIEGLRQSGEIYQYSLIWLNSITGWTAIEEEVDAEALPPPPPPPLKVAQEPSIPKRANIPEPEQPFAKIDALCFDKKTVIAGKLQNVSALGCILYSNAPVNLLPAFRVGAEVSLNMLSILSGSSENTPVTIKDVRQGEEYWEYKLGWNFLPSLLNPKSKSN